MIDFGDDDGASDGVRAELRAALRDMNAAEQASARLAASVGSNLGSALGEAALGTARFGDALRRFGQDLSRDALRSATAPLRRAIGDGVSGLAARAAEGLIGAVSGGAVSAGVRAFAKGGVVEGPVAFPLAGGAGVMGEAGPEAVLPLARSADGRLGVRGGGGAQVVINVTTPDAESFRRSGPQIAAALARAVDRGRRGL